MYLEKLEIQGFKSFAHKNVLIFPGILDKDLRGITSIIGPNGSGKSNIADAVRWALGEQSMKTLRGKKGEDIIFSGSDKKGGAGLAEVSLFLNNEDGEAKIDYSQIVLTRRLYRDDESEYYLNQSRVRLNDMQIMLAKANFGQKTYSVIGQGLVEGFLSTTLSERKEFFDEATGVTQYQIKRDDSLNKLIRCYENLNQALMLLSEIEPQFKGLTRQVNKLKRRDEIEAELQDIQKKYYGKIWHDLNDKFKEYNKNFLEIEKIRMDKEKKSAEINRELGQLEKQSQNNNEFGAWQKELNELQAQKESLTKRLVKAEAELEIGLEAKGNFDLSWLYNKNSEIEQELKNIAEEAAGLENNIAQEKRVLIDLEEEKKESDAKITGLNNDKLKPNAISENQGLIKINQELKNLNRLAENSIGLVDLAKIKINLKEIRRKLGAVINLSAAALERENFPITPKNLMSFMQEKEAIIIKISESNFRVSARSERVKLIKEKEWQLKQEHKTIENKLKQNQKVMSSFDREGRQRALKDNLNEINLKIFNLNEKLNSFNSKEKEQRNKLFSGQRNLQLLQNEVNRLNGQLNELKVNATRYETKLEDLEAEIRNNFLKPREVKEKNMASSINTEQALEKIISLKHQIDQIGRLDPETEKEYEETKERFDYLAGQTHDLNMAIGSLEKIIKELDVIIKERFDHEFKNISVKFEEYFKILFNGGQAKIVKIMAEDLAANKKTDKIEVGAGEAAIGDQATEDKCANNLKRVKFLQKYNSSGLAGIEIMATPPGKKIKSIAMLSGGERALTAIGLICAIISCNPSPFVVLDEVDASLDEANSERLAKILDDLSHKTQFIIITHNRALMRRANILYGVTMEENGVSKLLSVKLDEARTIIKK